MSAEPPAIEPNGPVGVARFATATLLMLVLDRFFALAFTVLISASYGTSRLLDDYLFAVVGPMLIATLLGDLFYSLLLPELMKANTRLTSARMAWNLLGWITIGLMFVTGVYALCWTLLVDAWGHGGEPLMTLGLIASLLIFLGGVSAFGGTVLVSARRYFASVARIPIASLVTVITFLLWLWLGSGVIGLAVSVVAGALAAALMMIALMVMAVGRPTFNMTPAAAAGLIRVLGAASLAQIVAGIAAQAPTLVERLVAFPLGPGVLSSINYGRVLVSPPLLVAQSIATASYPRFVNLSLGQNEDRYRSHWRVVAMVVFLVLPMSVLLLVLAHSLVLIVYHRGAFDNQSVARTAVAAAVLSAGLVPVAVSTVLTRFLYAERAFNRVAYAWALTLAAYTALALALGHAAGYVGIAAASSASNFLLTIALFYSLHAAARRREQLPWKSLIRTVLASAAAGAVLLAIQPRIGEPTTLPAQVALSGTLVVVGLAIYVLSSWALKSPELLATLGYARRLAVTAKLHL